MIQYIDKEIKRVEASLSDSDDKGLLNVLNFFKVMLECNADENYNGDDALINFNMQFLNLKGDVNLKMLTKQFFKLHKLKQGKRGLPQSNVSKFLNGKSELQSNNVEKLFNFNENEAEFKP